MQYFSNEKNCDKYHNVSSSVERLGLQWAKYGALWNTSGCPLVQVD